MAAPFKATVRKDQRGEWRATLYARNGQVVATPGEGYKRKGNAIKAATRLGVPPERVTVEE